MLTGISPPVAEEREQRQRCGDERKRNSHILSNLWPTDHGVVWKKRFELTPNLLHLLASRDSCK